MIEPFATYCHGHSNSRCEYKVAHAAMCAADGGAANEPDGEEEASAASCSGMRPAPKGQRRREVLSSALWLSGVRPV